MEGQYFQSNEVDPPQIGGSLMNGWTSCTQVRDEAVGHCLEWNKILKKGKKRRKEEAKRIPLSHLKHVPSLTRFSSPWLLPLAG